MSEENTNPTTEPTVEETQQLTINDLVALKSIIDVASQRGAFKPNEMVAVGQTYNRLTAFLDSTAKAAQTPQGE